MRVVGRYELNIDKIELEDRLFSMFNTIPMKIVYHRVYENPLLPDLFPEEREVIIITVGTGPYLYGDHARASYFYPNVPVLLAYLDRLYNLKAFW